MTFLKPNTLGRNKFTVRWQEGIWLGIREESGEAIVGTPDGVLKARSIRRVGSVEERWRSGEGMKGVPWEPIPGREGIEIRSSVNFGPSWTPVGEAQQGKEKAVRRRGAQIRAEDVRKYRATEGCPGCVEQERGRPGTTHKKHCRERFEKIWKEKGDPRVEKAFERILKHEDKKICERIHLGLGCTSAGYKI